MLLSLLVGFTRCTSLGPPATVQNPKTQKPLSIIYASNRFGELEPCQCALKQLGGVDREWNLTQKWYASSVGTILSLTGGTTFVPIPKEFKRKRLELYLNKAEFLVQALNVLGVTALSPSAQDMVLGVDKLRSLEEKAKFPFVSTNLYYRDSDKVIFRPFVEVEHGEMSILVLGISAPPKKAYRNNEVRVVPPKEALDKLFASLPPRSYFVVVLSSLSEKQRQALQQQFPQIHLVLGSDFETPATFNARQWTGTSLYLHPSGQGRTVSLLEFEMKTPIVSFYNTWQASNMKDLRKVWADRVTRLEAQIQTVKTKKEKRLLEKKTEYEAFLKRTKDIPLDLSVQTIPYRSTTVELDEQYALPDNELSKLLKRYRASIRRRALREKNRKPQELIPPAAPKEEPIPGLEPETP